MRLKSCWAIFGCRGYCAERGIEVRNENSLLARLIRK
jgi:hypothetical protein